MLATISAAARELGVSPDLIRRRIHAGDWPFYRLGVRAVRVNPQEIRELCRLVAQSELAEKERAKK